MLWINVGCGPYLADKPWINVDGNDSDYVSNFASNNHHEMPRKPDVIGWSDKLPYKDGEVSRLYAGHILEHIDLYDGSVDRTLAEFKRVLCPGGERMCVGPDLVKAAEMVYHGAIRWQTFWEGHGTAGRGNPAGSPYPNAKPGDVHLWSTTEEAVVALLRKYFDTVTPHHIADADEVWPFVSRVGWQYAVSATK